MLSGFRHHDPDLESLLLERYLTGESADALALSSQYAPAYFDVMGPDRLRAAKNGFIAMTAIVCRAAIRLGLDSEQSYSLSDYYLCAVESCGSTEAVEALALESMGHFAALVQALDAGLYSPPVAKGVRYVKSHLYRRCRVEDMAGAAGRNPQYFSRLFQRETGLSPCRYIRKKKLEEAARLLGQGEHSVAETAELLGFCSSSYFAREFRKEFKESPKAFAQRKRQG